MAKPKKNNLNKSFQTNTSTKSTLSSKILAIQQPKPKSQPKIPQPQGFKFISNTYSVHLQCPLCSQLMIKPMRLHPCGHTFCQKCIDPFIDDVSQKVCPYKNCLRKFQLPQDDRTAANLIDELKVQCTNEPCVYKGVYDHYKKNHKDSCPFKNGGIDAWLGNLTNGLVLTQRSTQILNRKESDQLEGPQQKKERLEIVEEYVNEDSQKIQNGNENEPGQNQEKQEQRERKEQRKQEKQGSKREQEKSMSNTNSQSLNNTSSDSGRNLIFSIFDIPFGPSIRQQMNSEEIRKQEFMKKEIKKLQG